MNLNRLWYFLCKIFSYSPILRITDDLQFGEIRSESLRRLRISLISFNFGRKIIHFITFHTNTKELKLLKILDLEELCDYPNEDNPSRAYDSYKNEIQNASEETLLIHKEALTYKINQLETTKSMVFNKYVAYIAIVALILPLYGSQFDKIYKILDNYKIIFLIILAFVLVNLLLFFNEFIRVRGFKRTVFSSIRNSNTPLKELTASIYYEWLTIKSESNFQVTLIKNIEKYMKGFVLISILLLASINIEEYIGKEKENSVKVNKTNISSSNLIKLDATQSDVDFLKRNDLSLTNLKKKLLYNKIEKIIILSNKKTSNYKTLMNFINIYNKNSASIIELKDSSTQQISVIVIEED